MFLCDSAVTVSRERTPEGFLRVRARIGRAGLHDYKAREIGGPPGLSPDATVRVHRPADEVFDAASMVSFAGKPVTLDHPPAMVDSANWKHFAVGHSGQVVNREGDHLVTELVITDAAAVARAESGVELSNGYWADFIFTPGTTPDGEPYDALQRNIRGNHIALVDAGRCGPTCGIDSGAEVAASATCKCDRAAGRPAAGDKTTMTIEGVVIETTPEAAAALDRLQASLDAALASHRREVEVKDGEIAALKAGVPDPATLDAMLEERARVIDAARAVLGRACDTRGQSTSAIRRAAVGRLLGPEQIRDRGEDYVAAAFDTLVAMKFGAAKSGNPLASHLAAGLADSSSQEAALAARNRYLTQAWMGDAAQGHNAGGH